VVVVVVRIETSMMTLACSPDVRTVAGADFDGDVRLWNPRTGRTLRVLRGNGRWVRCIAFGPDGRALASEAKDGIRLWDAATWRDVGVLPAPAPWGCDDLAFS